MIKEQYLCYICITYELALPWALSLVPLISLPPSNIKEPVQPGNPERIMNDSCLIPMKHYNVNLIF